MLASVMATSRKGAQSPATRAPTAGARVCAATQRQSAAAAAALAGLAALALYMLTACWLAGGCGAKAVGSSGSGGSVGASASMTWARSSSSSSSSSSSQSSTSNGGPPSGGLVSSTAQLGTHTTFRIGWDPSALDSGSSGWPGTVPSGLVQLRACERAQRRATAAAVGASTAATGALSPSPLPEVLVATIIRDTTSGTFRTARDGSARNLTTYLEFLGSYDYPPCRLSLGLLTSDEASFRAASDMVAAAVKAGAFTHATVVLRAFVTGTEQAGDRHDANLQLARRRMLASARNYLLMSALRDEGGVLWVDADITEARPGLLRDAVASGRDVLAPLIRTLGGSFYDRNTWALPTAWLPTCDEQKLLVAANGDPEKLPPALKAAFTHRWILGSAILADALVEKAGNQLYVPVDAVGSAWLYVRAEVHRAGATFTTEPIIGASWEGPGYDGQESEGLCYIAKGLGFKCWLMAQETAVHAH